MKKSAERSEFLKTLLKIYPLDDDSKTKIKRDIHYTPCAEPLNKLFAENGRSDHRAFLSASLLHDDSYDYFRNIFYDLKNEISQKEWKEGKMESGVKIKKFIQDYYTGDSLNKTQKSEFFDNYLKKPYEECIAKKTSNNAEVKLLITRNPLDLFFCSASLSFSSCMDVVKQKGYTYAYGLINTIPNPGQFLIAKVRGWQYVMYGGTLYKIPNIISRSFAHLSDDNRKARIIRWYNGKAIPDKTLNDILGVDTSLSNFNGHKFIPYSLQYGNQNGKLTPFQYSDNGGISIANDLKHGYYNTSAGSGNYVSAYTKDSNGNFGRNSNTLLSDMINHDPATEAVSCLNYYTKQRIHCHKCGESLNTKEFLENGHACTEVVKKKNSSWFGETDEKVYPVRTEQKKTVYFPQSEVVKFMKRKEIYIHKNRLNLKGVA